VNLPGGEIITSPESVEGAYLANGTLGDADGALNRLLQSTPITLRIAGARVKDVFSDQKIPGVHLSLGETFPQATGATWTSNSWIAFTSVEHDADIDKTRVLRRGRYVF
jgi:hypothetical protein